MNEDTETQQLTDAETEGAPPAGADTNAGSDGGSQAGAPAQETPPPPPAPTVEEGATRPPEQEMALADHVKEMYEAAAHVHEMAKRLKVGAQLLLKRVEHEGIHRAIHWADEAITNLRKVENQVFEALKTVEGR